MDRSHDIIQQVEQAERILKERSLLLTKATSKIASSKKQLSGPSSLPVLKSLVQHLDTLPQELCGSEWNTILKGLTDLVSKLSRQVQDTFPTELRNVAEENGLRFQVKVDRQLAALGPFGLRLDFDNFSTTLEYAKLDVSKNLPLNPQTIVDEVQRLRDELLAPLSDFMVFAQQLEESIRVVTARRRRSLAADPLRAELPLVYREMLYLRQGWESPTAKRKYTEYPLARFIVEIKSFLQSQYMMELPRRFEPEPAVIENTKNLNKAFFFPNDINDGCGEGTYIQTIKLSQNR